MSAQTAVVKAGTQAWAAKGHLARRRYQGYAILIVTYLVWGSMGALVRYADAPESVLIVVRMAIAFLVLAALFARRATLVDLRSSGAFKRLLVMAVISPTCLLLFFITLRLTDVAIGMFMLFMAPVYVGLLAPRLLRQRPDRVVAPALALALAGMVAILVPALTGMGRVSAIGVACGVATGLLFAAYQLIVKSIAHAVRSSTIVLVELAGVLVVLSPLAAWQGARMDAALTHRDWIAIVFMGLFCTALAYMLYVEGVRRVRVEHASILGYLEPLSAPVYAVLLLGETPATTTLAGGALIVVAGILVIRYGSPDPAPEPGLPPSGGPSGGDASGPDVGTSTGGQAPRADSAERDANAMPIR